MATLTRMKLGPADHGREMSLEEFDACQDEEGYRSEIIDGKVYVTTLPDLPHESIGIWLFTELLLYIRAHPEIIGFVTPAARVFVPTRPKATVPQPDITVYHSFPHDLSLDERDWRDISPMLVVEIVSRDDPRKDLERNVALYVEVQSIREYWIIDPRPDSNRPTLWVYRRRGNRWQKPIEVPAGGTYESPKLLPGFSLLVDPHRRS
jgi:Uma2 family endonuclease